jgi:hypothetical protein
MKNVIVAWCKTNERDFEEFVPLNFVGQRNLKLGFRNDFHIVFLEGFDRLSEWYKKMLQDSGYTLHDAVKLYDEIDAQYKQLDRLGDYGKKCFLRWLAVERLFSGEGIIHYDGDIVLNEDPAVIAKKVAGKTFVLQGCPAFTVISNQDWFEQYKNQLDLFANDVEGYSEKAWLERSGWEVTFKTRWAGSRFEKVFLHDQDFISHLIHTGRIQQDPVEEVMAGLQDYVAFENPLFLDVYDGNHPYKYLRENGIDYLSYNRFDDENCSIKKRVLFWHMQSCFNFYLSKFILRKKYIKFFPAVRLDLHLQARGLEDYINKKLRRFLNHTSRLNVYKYFFEQSDFSGIFKKNIWWKTGTFR